MALLKPIPLYPVYEELKHLSLNDYPQLQVQLNGFTEWQRSHFAWGKQYLEYIGRNKSEHTYVRFRNEIERFLLWSILVKNQAIDTYRKSDVLDYADFCWQPPVTWIATQNHDRFKFENSFCVSNEAWRQFKIQAPKSALNKEVQKKQYKPSQQTLTSTFTG